MLLSHKNMLRHDSEVRSTCVRDHVVLMLLRDGTGFHHIGSFATRKVERLPWDTPAFSVMARGRDGDVKQ